MIKKILSGIIRKAGYHLSKIDTLERQINRGDFKWLQEMGIHTILDVGANVGKFSIKFDKIINDAMIYAFEPLSDCYKLLLDNTKHIKGLKCYNLGLGRESKDALIFHNEFSPSSSLLEMNDIHKDAFPHTKHSTEEKIKILPLDEMIDDINWNKKVLLKIDVQGYELEVLNGAELSLNNIDLIIIETSFDELYKDQPLFNPIYKFLTAHHFNYEGNFDQFKDPRTGRILQADAIFLKH